VVFLVKVDATEQGIYVLKRQIDWCLSHPISGAVKTVQDQCGCTTMTCPEFNSADNTCGVDGFKFYQGMQKPCDSPGITKEKCPRFAMK
jgi:hypothetical protein